MSLPAAPATRTKICGVTDARDALTAIDLGAAFLGLNFYPPSPRYLAPQAARELLAAVRRQRPEQAEGRTGRVQWVGVFVGASTDEMVRTADLAGLDLLQLHGDEEPAEVAALGDWLPRVIKVFRLRGKVTNDEIRRRMEPWRALGVWGFLVDTFHPELYGGTGETWDASSFADLADDGFRWLLAGGLGPHNVRDAVNAGRPWGIDLCSGVESDPGRKDPHLMRRLFEELHHGTTHTAA